MEDGGWRIEHGGVLIGYLHAAVVHTRFSILDSRFSILDSRSLCRDTGQLAQLLTVPVAHVVEVPLHLAAARGYFAFLFLDLFDLTSQSSGGRVDLACLLVHLGLPEAEAGFALGQGSLHLGHLSLPVDQLLAEGGHAMPMLIAGTLQGEFLLPDALGFGLQLGAERLQVFAAGLRVRMHLGKVLAQLCTGLGQAFGGGLSLHFQLRKVAVQLGSLFSQRRQLRLCCCYSGGGLLALLFQMRAILRQLFALAADLLTCFFQAFDMPVQGLLTLVQIGAAPIQLRLVCLQLREALGKLSSSGLKLGLPAGVVLLFLLLSFGKGTLAPVQFLRAAAQLLLEAGHRLLRPGQPGLAVAQRLPFGRQTLFVLLKLIDCARKSLACSAC